MAGPLEFLFVYGTLLSGDTGPTGRSQRARLAREARLVGMGSVGGRLYNLGRYPGLVLGVDAGERVYGEVLELASPARTLRWLDAYEGIVPGQHTHNEYERREVEVLLDLERVLTAGTYVYQGDVASMIRIASGRWL